MGLGMSSDMDLELDPIPALYTAPDLDQAPLQASDLLSLLAPDLGPFGESSPDLVATDPFEYEVACKPKPPSHVARALKTNPFPEGAPAKVWSYLAPPPPKSSPAQTARRGRGAVEETQVELWHPRSLRPSVAMRTAHRVGLPVTEAFAGRRVAAPTESSLRILEMEPAPVTSVELEVSLQSDVLLQLLDQQIPHPDRLYALTQFAAQQSALVFAGLPREQILNTRQTVLPTAAASVIDYRLSGADLSRTGMLRLSMGVLAAQGSVVSPTAISDIPATLLVTLPVRRIVEQAGKKAAWQVGIAGLQRLRSNLSQPAPGVFTARAIGSGALDLSTGVSSDVTFPTFVAGDSTVPAPGLTNLLPLTFKKRRQDGQVPRVEPLARLLPQAIETHPLFPDSNLQPLDTKPPEDFLRAPETKLGAMLGGEGLKKFEPAWAHATGFWHHAPRDLKLLLFAIPALLALVFHPGLPRIAFAAPRSSDPFSGSFTNVVNREWGNVRQTLENRAAIALDEDFRSGLDNWASPGGSTTEWSFDPTGFVRPGPLALYRPSVGLADYQVQFMGTIDKKALSWVVRAADFENFYVVKLAIVKSGPIPSIGLTRYAVINGKARDRRDVNIPLVDVRTDTNYRVRMDVQGSDFSVEVQGQMADSWTETRLPRGGIGFFTASGEASRLRWVQITHQYDMLGRLCAYLAPYDTTNGSWQP
jgi:hypothetical protein